jgi:GT2 family glycosyltransferase
MLAILAGVDLGNEKLSPPPTGYAPAGSNLIAKRTLFDKVGGYSEVHFRHMDYEFGIRCAKAGIQITYEPSLIVYAPVDSACLTKRYFRRWAFKAGILNEEEISARSKLLLGIPLWRFRQLFEDILLVMLSMLKDTNKAPSFNYELRICRNYGMIISRFMKKIRPKYYSLWVEKYSQKKGNLY